MVLSHVWAKFHRINLKAHRVQYKCFSYFFLGHPVEYEIKESNKCDCSFKMIPVLVSAELQLLYKYLRRQYIECCEMSPPPALDLHLMQQIDKQHRLQFAKYCQNHPDGYQNYSLELCLRMNAYFASMGMQHAGIWGTKRPVEENQVPVNNPGIMF